MMIKQLKKIKIKRVKKKNKIKIICAANEFLPQDRYMIGL